MSTALAPERATATPGVEDRMLVVWQHPRSRSMEPVAILGRSVSGYTFRYLGRAREVSQFRPLLGFDDLDRGYHSDELFPIFDGRVMSDRRPDYRDYLHVLGLQADAGPWEQLSRSQGTQATDTLQLFPTPRRVGDRWQCRFLVHGIRHVPSATTPEARNPDVNRHLSLLRAGDALVLRDDPDNAVSPAAVLTCDGERHTLGWVPDFLVDHVRALCSIQPPELRVATINAPSTPGHLRLAVTMSGRAPDGYEPFASAGYEPLV